MAKEIIRIGLDKAPPIPLHTALYGGSFKGYEVDLLERLAADLNLEILYSEAPWPILLQQLTTRRIDAICSAATVTPERRQYLQFSQPYLAFQLALVCREDHLLTLDQLHEHPVGVRTGTTGEQYLVDKLQQAPAFRSDSNEELYNLLLNGIIHGVIDDSPIARGFVKLHPELTIATLLPGAAHQYAIAFNAGNDALTHRISNGIHQLQASGHLEKLQHIWFGTDPL